MHWIKGRVTRQAHVDIPEGCVEDEFGRGGFGGKYAHLYRTEAPVGWSRIEGELKPRAYQATTPPPWGVGARSAGRVPLLENEDVVIAMAHVTEPMDHWFRNADGDELFFVHEGAGTLYTDFGPLGYRPGDYLVVPRGTAWRLAPDEPTRALVCQTAGELDVPEKGLLGQHALFDPAMVEVPEPAPAPAAWQEQSEWELRIQRLGAITRVFYPFDPVNAVGWKGTLSAWRINVADIRPVLSDRYHLPPSAHATLVADGVIIVTFLPRPLENGDPGALKVPFYHSNIDYDEVIFYHQGDFFSREGIGPGMLTFHPQGLHHGPQPAAVERSKEKRRTDEVAVMIDTRRPLRPTEAAAATEWADYWRSWGAQ